MWTTFSVEHVQSQVRYELKDNDHLYSQSLWSGEKQNDIRGQKSSDQGRDRLHVTKDHKDNRNEWGKIIIHNVSTRTKNGIIITFHLLTRSRPVHALTMAVTAALHWHLESREMCDGYNHFAYTRTKGLPLVCVVVFPFPGPIRVGTPPGPKQRKKWW